MTPIWTASLPIRSSTGYQTSQNGSAAKNEPNNLLDLEENVDPRIVSFRSALDKRGLTGLWLGGVRPCTIAVVSDYAPTRARNLMLAISSSGFAIGGSLGGFVAAATIERFGWQTVFWIGGIVPLLILPVLLIWFPESLSRLLSDPSQHSRLEKVVARLAPGWTVPEGQPSNDERNDRFPVAALFSKGLAVPTLLIWSIFLCSLLLLYFF